MDGWHRPIPEYPDRRRDFLERMNINPPPRHIFPPSINARARLEGRHSRHVSRDSEERPSGHSRRNELVPNRASQPEPLVPPKSVPFRRGIDPRQILSMLQNPKKGGGWRVTARIKSCKIGYYTENGVKLRACCVCVNVTTAEFRTVSDVKLKLWLCANPEVQGERRNPIHVFVAGPQVFHAEPTRANITAKNSTAAGAAIGNPPANASANFQHNWEKGEEYPKDYYQSLTTSYWQERATPEGRNNTALANTIMSATVCENKKVRSGVPSSFDVFAIVEWRQDKGLKISADAAVTWRRRGFNMGGTRETEGTWYEVDGAACEKTQTDFSKWTRRDFQNLARNSCWGSGTIVWSESE